jgi:hypothetical protein
MSRVSIGRRLERLFEHYRPGDSLAGRVARLSDDDRERYEAFTRLNARALAKVSDDPGEAFGAWLSGKVALDELPLRISDAIMPENVAVRAAIAAGDFYDAWNRMARPDRA